MENTWSGFYDSENVTESAVQDGDVTESAVEDGGHGDMSLVTMRIAAVLVGTVGVLDNGAALLVIYRVPGIKKRFGNAYMIHQCVTDLILSVLLIITYLTFLFVDKLRGYSGFVLCKVLLSETFLWTTFSVSTTNLVCLNVDRYIIVVHNKRYVFFGQKWVKSTCVVGLWVLAVATTAVVQLETTGVVNEACYQSIIWPSVEVSKAWGYATFVAHWLIPMVSYVCIYSHIFFVVRKSRIAVESNSVPEGTSSQSSDGTQTRSISPAEKKVLQTLVLVCLMYALCVTPLHIYYLLYNLGYDLDFSSNAYYVCLVLVMANCATNPFVYLANVKEFRTGLRMIFVCQN